MPLNFERDNIGDTILEKLKLGRRHGKANMMQWKNFVSKIKKKKRIIKIAIIGKYFGTGDFILSDAYFSVIEAIKFSAYKLGAEPEIHWLNARDFEKKSKRKFETLKQYNGIIVPGGFGASGIDGKLAVIQYAREKKIPLFGLCYGMQLMVIEYARNVLKLKGAHTTEIAPETAHPVIDIILDQKKKLEKNEYGGTMRLGVYPAYLKKGTIARKAYGKELVEERHRHRYEINPNYVEKLSSSDLVFSGISPDKILMEIAELPQSKHPFFLGVQFHPEFQARPLSPHPLFNSFIQAAMKRRRVIIKIKK